MPRILSINIHQRPYVKLKRNLFIKNPEQKIKNRNKKIKYNNDKINKNYVSKLIEIMNPKRAEDYNSWMEMGWCLYNIFEGSEDGYELWCKFSEKCPDKFNKDKCEQEWDNMINKNKYSVGTIIYFAKKDNLEKYKEITLELAEKSILESIESNSHNHVAKVMYHLFGDEFICAKIKPTLWFQWTGNYWKEIEEGIYLQKKLSNDVYNIYKKSKKIMG